MARVFKVWSIDSTEAEAPLKLLIGWFITHCPLQARIHAATWMSGV